MRNNKLKRNGGSTPFSLYSDYRRATPAWPTELETLISAIKIMTGELAPARHVPCAATRCREPGSNPPFDATLVATVTPRPF